MALSHMSILQFVLLIITFASVSRSSPMIPSRYFLWSCKDLSPHETTWGLPEKIVEDLSLFSKYAAAAYCEENNNFSATKLICSAGNCPLVGIIDVTSYDEFENTGKADDTGFLTIDQMRKLVVLTFRGSASCAN